jgi:hypothetical protein
MEGLGFVVCDSWVAVLFYFCFVFFGFAAGDFFAGDVVGEGHVAGGAEAAYVCAVLVLYAEEGPHAAAAHFGEGDDKGGHGGVLELERVDGVGDPVEAEDGVDDHCGIVGPCTLVTERRTKEGAWGIGVAERPVHDDVPDAYDIQSVLYSEMQGRPRGTY